MIQTVLAERASATDPPASIGARPGLHGRVAFSSMRRSGPGRGAAADRFDGPALLVQDVMRADPFSGHLLVFRGKRAGRSGRPGADQPLRSTLSGWVGDACW
ncbi:MAG: hypothetical protein ACRYG8_30430 [Janthinobacterium lividum]